MEHSAHSSSGRAAPSTSQSSECPMCGAGVKEQSGISVCDDCDWYQRFPAD
ncbi:hypothetical protein [Haloarcula onubensis]|uniref:Small CPxCG-related zinc finger protein n=1 Tax=Haloarcula onubensis TaxID=2950539 RepID=A0ABU2FIZ0_9EURY|nr:hypothetical protein [Halomicroarcula sp. S3CR25-11]MDS0280730.1 hypothetical protein [Halomicroarcula sp. S3CR25-11]